MTQKAEPRESTYRRIAQVLQDRVNSGQWRPGDRLPTEPVLAAEFGVNRLTVRQALAELRQLGVVDIRHGSGTFVANPPPVLEIAVDPTNQVDTGSVHASIKSIRTETVETVLTFAPDCEAEPARHLGVDAGSVVRLDTLVGSGGDPFAVSSYWLDGRRFPDLSERWLPDVNLAAVLRESFGVTLFYDWRAFTAAAAGRLEVEHLGGPVGAPLIVRYGVSVDADGVPVYYVRRRIRAARASYVMRYRGQTPA